MAQPYVGEVRMFAGNFAPAGWMFCEGQLLPISEYQTLFNLIGTTYGGDGQSTFALPDLRGRVPVHMGTANGSFTLAQTGGVEQVTLTTSQIPAHTHAASANPNGTSANPSDSVWAGNPDEAQYAPPDGLGGQMNAGAIQATGGNQPHDNLIPYLCIDFIISLFGIYPSQT